MIPNDPYTRAVFASGMERGARISQADYDDYLGDVAERASWRTLIVVLALAVVAAWFGRRER